MQESASSSGLGIYLHYRELIAAVKTLKLALLFPNIIMAIIS